MKSLKDYIYESVQMITEHTRGTLIIITENNEYIYYVIHSDAYYEDGYGEEFEKISKKYKFNSTRIISYLDKNNDEYESIYKLLDVSEWKKNDWDIMTDYSYIIDCSKKQFLTFNCCENTEERKQFKQIAKSQKMINPKPVFTINLFSYLDKNEAKSYWNRIFAELNLNNLNYNLKSEGDYDIIKFNISNDNEFIMLAAFLYDIVMNDCDSVEDFIVNGLLYWKLMYSKYEKEIKNQARKLNKNSTLWNIVDENS